MPSWQFQTIQIRCRLQHPQATHLEAAGTNRTLCESLRGELASDDRFRTFEKLLLRLGADEAHHRHLDALEISGIFLEEFPHRTVKVESPLERRFRVVARENDIRQVRRRFEHFVRAVSGMRRFL
jgi:hypothetical protein